MALLLSAQNLTQSASGRILFKDLNLAIEEGQKVGLIGPNGAGKSTLLKILSNKLSADKGSLHPSRGLRLGFLQQDPQFSESLSILEVMSEAVKDSVDAISLSYEWLAKLDLLSFGESYPAAKLSGGWKKRLALACELAKQPNLLFLDEPTNHLDIEGIIWLEEFLADNPISMVMVTHDRLFLQRSVNEIWELNPAYPDNLKKYKGSYAEYLDQKEIFLAGQRSAEERARNTLRRETEWLRRGAIARQTKQKARIQSAGNLKQDVEKLTQLNRQQVIQIEFEEAKKSPKKILEFKKVSKSFDDELLIPPFDLLIHSQTRLGLFGANGAGKSTLLKCITGEEKWSSGEMKITDGIKIAYIEQDRSSLRPELSLAKNICPEGDYVNFRGQYMFHITYLERYGFRRDQMDLPVKQLSGGEQARLRMAQILLTDCQLLILDEPTNDLDMNTLEVLAEALENFPGALILVSHDRYFMDECCHELLYLDKGKNPEKFASYLQWEEWKTLNKILLETSDNSPQMGTSKDSSSNSANRQKTLKFSFKEKMEYESIEAKISTAEESLASKKTELENPEVVSNSTRLTELCQQIEKLEKEIESLYNRWAELQAKADLINES